MKNLILKIKNLISSVTTDTLKIYDPVLKKVRFSRTSLTMVTAWFSVLYSYIYDLHTNGFRTEAFAMLVGVAIGTKLADSAGKRVEKKKNSEEL